MRLRNGRTIVATDPVELHALIVRDHSIEKVTDKHVPQTPPNSKPWSPDSS